MDRFRWSKQPLTQEYLTSFARDVAVSAGYHTAAFTNTIHVFIIVHFLGREWYQRYAYLNAEKGSYLAPDFGENGRAPIYSMRILNLAEMLYNLQAVEGFEYCLAQLASGELESSLAELQLGMMLYQAHHKIRYINPAAVSGKTYDLEIDFPNGNRSCGEIKCKEDMTDISVETIRNSLNTARGQLPSGGDGVVFVKVPQTWANANGQEIFLRLAIAEATEAFLRGTTRVSLVVFYVFHLSELSGGIRNRHAIREFPNPMKPRCPWGLSLFPFNLPIRWIGMPDLVELWSAAE